MINTSTCISTRDTETRRSISYKLKCFVLITWYNNSNKELDNFSFYVKLRKQKVPVWILMWRLRPDLMANFLLHTVHARYVLLSCLCSCVRIAERTRNAAPHTPQTYLRSSLWVCLCWDKQDLYWKSIPQILQTNGLRPEILQSC